MPPLRILSSQERTHAARTVGAVVLLEGSERTWRVGPPAHGVEGADFMAIPIDDPLGQEPRRAEEIKHLMRDSEVRFSGAYDGKLLAANAIEKAIMDIPEPKDSTEEVATVEARRMMIEAVYQLRRYVPADRYTTGQDRGQNVHKV